MIEQLFAFVQTNDDGREPLMFVELPENGAPPQTFVPLVAYGWDDARGLIGLADRHAQGRPYRVLRFAARQDVTDVVGQGTLPAAFPIDEEEFSDGDAGA